MGIFKTFADGDLVLTSGVYTSIHSTPHTLIERELYVEGAHFERCKLCPFGVLYRLEEPSVHFFQAPNYLGG